MRASILCHHVGQTAAVALCMYQALEKACCTVASLCSGPETGLARWVRIETRVARSQPQSSPVGSGKNLILAHKDMSEVLLASKSLLHVDTNHRNLYSIYI